MLQGLQEVLTTAGRLLSFWLELLEESQLLSLAMMLAICLGKTSPSPRLVPQSLHSSTSSQLLQGPSL